MRTTRTWTRANSTTWTKPFFPIRRVQLHYVIPSTTDWLTDLSNMRRLLLIDKFAKFYHILQSNSIRDVMRTTTRRCTSLSWRCWHEKNIYYFFFFLGAWVCVGNSCWNSSLVFRRIQFRFLLATAKMYFKRFWVKIKKFAKVWYNGSIQCVNYKLILK